MYFANDPGCFVKRILKMSQSDFCLFRRPQESKVYILKGQCKKAQRSEQIENGFIFSSFDPEGPIFTISAEPEEWNDQPLDFGLSASELTINNSDNKRIFLDQTHQMLDAIKQGSFSKLVSARCLEVEGQFEAREWFLKLCDAFPGAFVYLFNSKETGCWMGASPELLLEQQMLNVQTVALAGTRISKSQGTFGHKEKQEQNLVAEYIEECFKQSEVEQYVRMPDEELITGNLAHICTRFEAMLKRSGQVWELLKNLHPTPAVAGMPKDEAIKMIQKAESFPREFYAGYLGLVSKHSKLFYVNIRCLRLFRNGARIYAGAGITIDSDPEREYEETGLKINNLLICLIDKIESQLQSGKPTGH